MHTMVYYKAYICTLLWQVVVFYTFNPLKWLMDMATAPIFLIFIPIVGEDHKESVLGGAEEDLRAMSAPGWLIRFATKR